MRSDDNHLSREGMRMKYLSPRFVLILSSVLIWTTSAYAQSSAPAAGSYPVKPVRVLLGFAPGGATDILARMLTQKLTENVGRSFVVEHHAGAGGTLAYALVAKAVPDGYVLGGVSSGYSISPAVFAKLSYDPVKDLIPISLVSQSPYLVVVHPSVPVHTVKALIALAKAKPGMLNAASAGVGSTPHLALEYFKSVVGVNITHVPYKGTGQGLIDLTAGHVHMLFGNVVSVSPHVKAGRLRALAITAPKRASSLPQIPTFAEAGVPEYSMTTWFGMMAPGGTPPAIINMLHAEIVKVLKMREVLERLENDGGEPVGSAPDVFMKQIVAEIERWRKITRDAGMKPE